ncbi:LysE family translocator [Maricaulis sp.]|uniref:LysE family translocator n=1 Tax=Maricaulis sp. TaxID=1486257 RepID=UPI0025B84F14|nr:LysE family translocator [Maricaulis sp.]
MLDPALVPIFLAGAVALALTPGPDMAFTLATAASRGPKAGLAATAGIITGGAIWTLLAAAGLAALLATVDHALLVVRYAGAAYLLYLAWKTFRHLDAPMEARSAASVARAFRRGLMTNLLNPKVGLFFLAFLPQFTNAELSPVWLQMLVLGGIFFAIGSLVLTVVALTAGRARIMLGRSATARRLLNGLSATAFGGLGLRLILVDDAA